MRKCWFLVRQKKVKHIYKKIKLKIHFNSTVSLVVVSCQVAEAVVFQPMCVQVQFQNIFLMKRNFQTHQTFWVAKKNALFRIFCDTKICKQLLSKTLHFLYPPLLTTLHFHKFYSFLGKSVIQIYRFKSPFLAHFTRCEKDDDILQIYIF